MTMKFRHPHDETYIVDRTELQPEDSGNKGATLLAAFISDKGVDGTVRTFNDLNKFLKEHGTPNIKKHGQSIYQIVNWLKGKGVVHCIRLTADNACYSNLMVYAELETVTSQKKDSNGQPLYSTTDGQETTTASGNTPINVKNVQIAIKGESFTDLQKDDASTLQDKMKSKDKSNGLKKIIPLFTLLSKGKGVYGDAYRIRLTPNHVADRDSTYRNYTFELFVNENGLRKEADPINVSVYPSAIDSYRRSEFMDDVIKKNIYPIKVVSYEPAFDKVVAELLPVLQEHAGANVTDIIPESIDFLFGFNKNGEPTKGIEILTEGALSLTALEGVQLGGGDDGDFAMTNPDRETNIYTKYKKCFNGDVDKAMLNKKKFPADIMLDANFTSEVKKAMQACRTKRDDGVLLLDACVLSTLSAAKAWRKSEMPADDYAVGLYFQHFTTFDEYTAKEITVTMPYLLSYMLPKHFNEVGNYKPMAGINYPIRDFIIEGSLKPSIYEDEDKNDFYDARLNYIEEEVSDLIIGTQLTSQVKTSELSNLNNVFTLYEMKRTIENLVPRFRYEFTESDADMANFNRLANQALQRFQDYKCKFVQVQISQSNYQKERKILQTKLGIGFKSFNERNYITMEISR